MLKKFRISYNINMDQMIVEPMVFCYARKYITGEVQILQAKTS